MTVTSKATSILLIALLASACCMAQALHPLPQLPAPSGGCHHHNPSAPPSHACCLTGHDAAMPQLSRAERPPVQPISRIHLEPSRATAIDRAPACSPLPAESPGATPLRV
ncbi:MAG: hypothetical protein WB817_08490 [Terriglobales bacterium]